MDKYEETFQTWNKVAKLYQEKFMDLDLYDESYNHLIELINNKNGKVLEIGCGPGNITKYLLNKIPQLNIKGIDVAPKMIELARDNNPLAEFEILDVRKIENIKDTFDVIACGFCMPYLSKKDCSKLFSDTKKLLNPAGLIYLSFVEGDYEQSGFVTGSSGDRSYFYYHSLEFIKKELSLNSFDLLQLFNISYTNEETHTVLIGRRNN